MSVALAEAEQAIQIEAGIHAGDDRDVLGGRHGQAVLIEGAGTAVTIGEQLVDGTHVAVLPSPRTDYAHTNASLRLDYYAQRAAEAGIISIDDALAWSESLAAAAAAGCFLCVVTMFMVAGRKP